MANREFRIVNREKLRQMDETKKNRVIIGMILQQSLLMGIIAYFIGYGLILLTYEKFPRRIVLEAFDLQVLFIIVIGICTISSFVGIRKALKVEPAEALGG